MDKEKGVHILISILKGILKWSIIVLAVIFTVSVLIVIYLLVSEYFYDGETFDAIARGQYDNNFWH